MLGRLRGVGLVALHKRRWISPAGRIPPDVELIMLLHQANGKSSPTVAAAYTNGTGGDHDDLHSQLRLWRVSFCEIFEDGGTCMKIIEVQQSLQFEVDDFVKAKRMASCNVSKRAAICSGFVTYCN